MRRRRRRPRRGDRERRYERLGRDPRRGLRDQVLAPLHRRAAETAVAARRRPPAARAGGRATGRAGARRAVARPHGPVPGGPGRARRPAGSPRPDLRRATRCVHRARPGVGGALDLAARPRRTDAVAARRLGRGRRPRVPRGGAARARRRAGIRRAGDRGRDAHAQRNGLRLHRSRETARRGPHGPALRREAFERARRAAAAPGRALEHGAVCLGGGALRRGGGRIRPRAQGRVAGARGRCCPRVLRRGPPRGGGRRRARALQAARRRGGDVPLGRHRVVGRAAPDPQHRRAGQCGGRQRHGRRRRPSLRDLVGERARGGDRARRHGGGARQRAYPGDAHGPRGAPEAARAAAVTHALYLLDPEPAPGWAPFAGIRPLCELRAGAALVRERWEAFVGVEATEIFALPHLAGFAEAGVPTVGARHPVTGPAIIGSSTFAPRGLAPALPPGAFRLTCGGITVGWGVGPGAQWDGPQPHTTTLEVPGVVLRGVHDLLPALEPLLREDLHGLLGDTDPIPAGSVVLGDPAWLALHDAAVEPGVVFDVRHGPG